MPLYRPRPTLNAPTRYEQRNAAKSRRHYDDGNQRMYALDDAVKLSLLGGLIFNWCSGFWLNCRWGFSAAGPLFFAHD